MTSTPTPIHHADFSLDDDQQAVHDAFSSFFENECPPERVRSAEPDGFDADLWKHIGAMRIVAMGVDPDQGGDGAGLVELSFAAEQWGKHLAPVPLAECITAARLLAAAEVLGGTNEHLAAALDGEQLVTIALHPAVEGRRQLVPAAAVADAVVALVDDRLVVTPVPGKLDIVANQGRTPLAWFDPSDGAVELARGPHAVAAFAEARRVWQLLMAAALTGMAEATLAIAVEHATERIAFGVPIGSFQAVAHPLVDVAMNTESSRRLTRKAAWWADTDSSAHRELVPMAYHFAEHTAVHATTVGVHTLGGVGFTVESDVQLYFRRAKGWSLVGGDPADALDDAADELFGSSNTTQETS
jgi:alkylation response protein AidB-like acyl-CoA dehydrogenase